MKRITLILGISLFFAFAVHAQAPLQEGGKQLNVGFGLSNFGLPVYGGMEFGIGNNISVGGEITYRNHGESFSTSKWKNTYTSIAGVGNYHFNELLEIPSNWDLYAGLSLGFTIFSSKWDSPGSDNMKYSGGGTSGLYLNGQIGGRYFFSDKMAVNLEFGSGNYFSGGKIGITVLL